MRMSYLRMNHSTAKAVMLNAMRFKNTQIYEASTSKVARFLLLRNICSLLMADVLVTPETKLWNMTTLVTIDQIARKVMRYPHCRKTLAYQSKLNEHLEGPFRATFKSRNSTIIQTRYSRNLCRSVSTVETEAMEWCFTRIPTNGHTWHSFVLEMYTRLERTSMERKRFLM